MKKLKRKTFSRRSAAMSAGVFVTLALAGWAASATASLAAEAGDEFYFVSPGIEARMSPRAPGLDALDVDGLGLGKRGANAIGALASSNTDFVVTVSTVAGGKKADYRRASASAGTPPPWSIEVNEHRLRLISQWSEVGAPEPLTLTFDTSRCHTTVLGILNGDGTVRLPALMHLPGQGSLRITATGAKDAALGYTAMRRGDVAVTFPPATAATPRIEYRLDVAAIYPELPGIAGDHRFDSFRRNWLNALQLNPGRRQLANNSGGTSCAFCYYEYADIAARTPPLADGLTALDVMRQTLETILGGVKAYGLPAPGNFPVESSDTLPSLLNRGG